MWLCVGWGNGPGRLEQQQGPKEKKGGPGQLEQQQGPKKVIHTPSLQPQAGGHPDGSEPHYLSRCIILAPPRMNPLAKTRHGVWKTLEQ